MDMEVLRNREEIERIKYEASFDAMARALRLVPATVSPEEHARNDCIRKTIEAALKEAGILPEGTDPVTVQNIIMGKIEPILNQPSENIPRSMLDIRTLGLLNDFEIRGFLKTQGIDLHLYEDRVYFLEMVVEALNYLKSDLLESPTQLNDILKDILKKSESAVDCIDSTRRDLVGNKKVPKEGLYDHETMQRKLDSMHFIPDLLRLFKLSARVEPNTQERREAAQQACGTLRIMAALNFIDRHSLKPLMVAANDALDEIVMDNISDWDPQGRVQGEMFGIRLYHRNNRLKDRERTIGKSLRSRKYGLQIPKDLVGQLFVTKRKSDLLRLIYKLYFDPKTAIFDSMSISIEDTKNSLFCPAELHLLLSDPEKAYKFFVEGASPEEIGLNIDAPLNGNNGAHANFNPHSSSSYQAAHVISYIPVRLPDGKVYQFPWEGQFMDLDSFAVNEDSHPGYLIKQKIQERKRVLSKNVAGLDYEHDIHIEEEA